MGSISLNSTKYAYVTNDQSGNAHAQASQRISYDPVDPTFLLSFEEMPAALRFKPISTIKLYFHATVTGKFSCSKLNYSDSDFDAQTVTYSTLPPQKLAADMSYSWSDGSSVDDPERTLWLTGGGISVMNALAILRGKSLWVRDFYLYSELVQSGTSYYVKHSELYLDTPLSNYKPYLLVEYSDTDAGLRVSASSNTGGYINPHIEQAFVWTVAPTSVYSVEIPAQADAELVWKEAGSSTEHTLTVADATQSLTVPAETFPGASSIQWKVRVHSTGGDWYESSWYTLSTADTLATATPVAPVTAVVDGSEPIRFTWAEANDSGSIPTGADLEYSTNGGTTWSTLASVSGTVAEYTAPASVFSAGEIFWRVRAYNIDGVAGPWTEASFICFAAPAAPFVSVTAVPFAEITWQSTGQQAYEITIDGESLGPKFGTDKTYKVQLPLSDGAHSVSVRVQGVYSLWSAPGTVEVMISNEPGNAVELEGAFAVDAALSWISADLSADFLIFRDGALIGHTDVDRFTDRFVLGSHSYYVINRLPSGNYSRSNTVEGRMCTRRPLIALLSGGEWLPLRYSERSMTQQSFTWSKTHSLRHIAGATYPFLELSPYEDLSGAYDAAFLCAKDAESFYQLRGQVVILKSKNGKVLIGAITSISDVVNTFYEAAQFTLKQIQWEDYIDDANS